MKIRDLMGESKARLLFLAEEATVAQALSAMAGTRSWAVLVRSGSRPCGIFTPRDLVRCHGLFSTRPAHLIRLSEVMRATPSPVRPEETLDQAMTLMLQTGTGHLPVVENQEVVTMLSLEDLALTQVRALTRELEGLKDYITDLQDAAHD